MLTQTLPLHLNPSISLKGVLSTYVNGLIDTQARAHTHKLSTTGTQVKLKGACYKHNSCKSQTD